ncbi:hypothetical protein Pla108_06380 [Botrimarina colliarenosi]|uniref:DUF1559 domain-containing protein n=1 Tax=Botrimarina colliarenosi TaxID=2528001 RepID=A0A5C6AKJ7_9BACT|nr:DUF1559 domain-containing protein [Botrimarina colliarenosi]TWT99695.1 hypothetical protein Pla108_06380 [Botrimarina colliarenosi]
MKIVTKSTMYLACTTAVLTIGVLWFAVREAVEAARQSACQGHMNGLQSALRNYEALNGHYPPAYINGPDGKPWHSWRVLLLPFLGEEAVYDQYRFDEPWNGPNNQALADRISPNLFRCTNAPGGKREWNTNYVAVVGKETAFPGAETVASDDIKDGVENTILLVEIGNSDIHWMEPCDLQYRSLTLQTDPEKASSMSVSSRHPAGPGVVFADRITAYRIHSPLLLSTLRGLLTIAGGEEETKESLEGWDNSGRYLVEPPIASD